MRAPVRANAPAESLTERCYTLAHLTLAHVGPRTIATLSVIRRPMTRRSLPLAEVRARLRAWEGVAALILIASVYSAIQSATPNIIGIDGYYHVKVAALMWQQGWRLLAPLDFPWLQLTILGPGLYSDHHFLFHALQAPFTMGDLRVGAKMASVLFATLGLYTSYHFLARHGVRYPVLWIAVLIACAPTFLWRHSMARPQALFLVLLIGAIWAVFAGRPWLLAPLGFLAVWLFDGFPFVLGIPIAALAAHLACWVTRKALTPPPPLPCEGEGAGG